jgi:hypothetical protein
MTTPDPDYPHIVLSFDYRGWKIEIDQGELNGQTTYAVWVGYDQGCAMAVPFAHSRSEAIRRARRWIDRRLSLVHE